MVLAILNGGSVEESMTGAHPKADEAKGHENNNKTQEEKFHAGSIDDSKATKSSNSTITSKSASRHENESKPARTKSDQTQSSNDDSNLSFLPICPNCSLPQLQYPRIGLNSRPPPDPSASYCANEPAIALAGHDVHGNAFPGIKPKHQHPSLATGNTANGTTSKMAKSKQSAKAALSSVAAAAAAANVVGANARSFQAPGSTTSPPPGSPLDSSTPSEPGTMTTGTATPPASAPNNNSTASEYPSIKTPQMRCPNNCGQWKAVNVMAKHLDMCMLGKGRKAGREAREKMGRDAAGAGGGGGGEGSRAGTPKPNISVVVSGAGSNNTINKDSNSSTTTNNVNINNNSTGSNLKRKFDPGVQDAAAAAANIPHNHHQKHHQNHHGSNGNGNTVDNVNNSNSNNNNNGRSGGTSTGEDSGKRKKAKKVK